MMNSSTFDQTALNLLRTMRSAYTGKANKKYLDAIDYSITRYERGVKPYAEAMQKIGFVGKDTALDVGCGAGHWCIALSKFNHYVAGIDDSEAYIQIARLVASNIDVGSKLHFKRGVAEKIEFSPSFFDLVNCHGVLMFTDHETALGEISRVLKEDGLFYCGYSGHGHYLRDLLVRGLVEQNNQRINFGMRILLTQFRYDVGIHTRSTRSYTDSQMLRLMETFGFELLERPGIQDGYATFLGVTGTYDMVVCKKPFTVEQILNKVENRIEAEGSLFDVFKQLITIGRPNLVLYLLEHRRTDLTERDYILLRCFALIKNGNGNIGRIAADLATLDQSDPFVCLAYGLHKHCSGDFKDAVQWYSRIDDHSQRNDVTFLIADALYQSGQAEKSLDYFQQLTEWESKTLRGWIGEMACAYAMRNKAMFLDLASRLLHLRKLDADVEGEVDEILEKGPF